MRGTATNSLFELVHSMQKSEKRYFRLFAQQQGSQNQNYLRLFDELLKMDRYDDEVLQKRAVKAGLASNLKATKKYLYDNILKCLKLYFVDYCISVKLPDALQNMRVLLNKGMFDDAARAYKKIEDIYHTNEQFGGLFDVLTFGERLWRTILPGTEAGKKLRSIYQQKQLCLQYLNNLNEYVFLKNEIELVFREVYNGRNSANRLQLEEFADHHLLRSGAHAMSTRAEMERFSCRVLLHLGLNEWTELYEVSGEALTMIADKKLDQYFVLNWRSEMHRLRCLAATRLQLESYDADEQAMETYLGEWSARVNLLDSIAGRFRHLLARCEYLFATERITPLLVLYLQEEQFVLDNWKYFDSTLRGHLALLLTQTFAHRGEFKIALSWAERITGFERDYALPAQIAWARMLELFLHIRLENYALAVSMARSTYRFLQKHGLLLSTERVLLKHLNRIAKSEGFEQEKHWNDLRTAVAELKKDPLEAAYHDGVRLDLLLRTIGVMKCRQQELDQLRGRLN